MNLHRMLRIAYSMAIATILTSCGFMSKPEPIVVYRALPCPVKPSWPVIKSEELMANTAKETREKLIKQHAAKKGYIKKLEAACER